jgi:uncharacterized protein involved in exopolysaccharide biosynthesis
MMNEWKERIEERKQKLTNLTDPRLLTLRTNISMAEGDMDRQNRLLAETQRQIAELNVRINAIPNAEVGLEALDREYQTKKTSYDNLLAQQSKIGRRGCREANSRAAAFRSLTRLTCLRNRWRRSV